jgi:hypothetical protein
MEYPTQPASLPGSVPEDEVHLQESLGAPVQDGTLPAGQVLIAQTGETPDEGRGPLFIP